MTLTNDMNTVFLQTTNDFFCVDPEHELGLLVRPECAGNDDVGPGGEVEPSGDLPVILIHPGPLLQNEGVSGGRLSVQGLILGVLQLQC